MTGVANEAGGEEVAGEEHKDGSGLLQRRTWETMEVLNVAASLKTGPTRSLTAQEASTGASFSLPAF